MRNHRLYLATCWLLLVSPLALAQDQVSGTVVEVDVAERSLTIRDEDDNSVGTYYVDGDTEITFRERGVARYLGSPDDGLDDIGEGAEVILRFEERDGRNYVVTGDRFDSLEDREDYARSADDYERDTNVARRDVESDIEEREARMERESDRMARETSASDRDERIAMNERRELPRTAGWQPAAALFGVFALAMALGMRRLAGQN